MSRSDDSKQTKQSKMTPVISSFFLMCSCFDNTGVGNLLF